MLKFEVLARDKNGGIYTVCEDNRIYYTLEQDKEVKVKISVPLLNVTTVLGKAEKQDLVYHVTKVDLAPAILGQLMYWQNYFTTSYLTLANFVCKQFRNSKVSLYKVEIIRAKFREGIDAYVWYDYATITYDFEQREWLLGEFENHGGNHIITDSVTGQWKFDKRCKGIYKFDGTSFVVKGEKKFLLDFSVNLRVAAHVLDNY